MDDRQGNANLLGDLGNVEDIFDDADRLIRQLVAIQLRVDEHFAVAANEDIEADVGNIRVTVQLENYQINGQTHLYVLVPKKATVGQLSMLVQQRYGIKCESQMVFKGERMLIANETLDEVNVKKDGDSVTMFVDDDSLEQADNGDEQNVAAAQQPEVMPVILDVKKAKLVFDEAVKLLATVQADFQNQDENLETEAATKQPRWECAVCTFSNLPYRPGCEQCCSDRPANYRIPANYKPTAAEQQWIADANTVVDPAMLVAEEKAAVVPGAMTELEQADDISLLYNDEKFECKICFTEIEPKFGARLHNCLHEFCLDCLRGHIEACQDAFVKCPFQDDMYKCDEVIEDREVRKIIGVEAFDKFQQRGLQQAEAATPNSFHCRTANCIGWCVVEDALNFFRCPICRMENCLLCKAIHTGMDCKQYQDDLRNRAANDHDAKATHEMLEREIRDGNAMRCPQCGIILQKKRGCDWLQCSMCKCEICWATRGPRWGPNGYGDTSGGCRCGVDGKSCHPDCAFCH